MDYYQLNKDFKTIEEIYERLDKFYGDDEKSRKYLNKMMPAFKELLSNWDGLLNHLMEMPSEENNHEV